MFGFGKASKHIARVKIVAAGRVERSGFIEALPAEPQNAVLDVIEAAKGEYGRHAIQWAPGKPKMLTRTGPVCIGVWTARPRASSQRVACL